MRTADFDYTLPEELIAQAPIEPRDAARLLVMDRRTDLLAHYHVHDLPTLLEPGDLVVVNRSRVLPARVHGRLRGGGHAQLLLLRRVGPGSWETLGRPARRLRIGDMITIRPGLAVRIVQTGEAGLREVHVESTDAGDPDARLLAAGSAPLPPYIHGWTGDPERYQTMFADVEGSAAAPTAGLHFTPRLVEALHARGIQLASLTLHVGLDTFRPITVSDPAHHRIHREWFEVPPELVSQLEQTRAAGGRVIAVGTTCVRALETAAQRGACQGWTDLFILPGHRFAGVDGLLTNFHLPRSSLLMLVSAFAGRSRVLAAYAEAIRQRYRFYSFGDAMLILEC